MRERIAVPCTIEIEQTPDSLHAHVSLEGVDVEPGDEVVVHGGPSGIAYGERGTFTARATVTRATAFERLLARLEGYRELTELYEVGFSAGRVA